MSHWTADEIRAAYRDRPLRIGVPKVVAYLTARLGLIVEDRTWSPKDGLVIHRGRGGMNVESFSVQQLAEAHHPDIDYIRVVDGIRQLQLAWNFVMRFFERLGLPVPMLEPLDRFGSIRWRSATGNETIRLELVERPAQLAHLLGSLSRTLWEEIKLEHEVDVQLDFEERLRAARRRRRNG